MNAHRAGGPPANLGLRWSGLRAAAAIVTVMLVGLASCTEQPEVAAPADGGEAARRVGAETSADTVEAHEGETDGAQEEASGAADEVTADPPETDGYRSRIRRLPDELVADMRRWTWEPGCPVHLDDLRLVEVVHVDLDGDDRWGRIVVHDDVADDVADAFGELHARGFPIARMEPVANHQGDDDASMAANNTSAFNCRPVTGSDGWSEHLYGWAIDINPVQNPYVRGDTVLPEAGRDYLDRDDVRPGMLVRGGPVEAFAAIGWEWGGDWQTLRDYQHVSRTGR